MLAMRKVKKMADSKRLTKKEREHLQLVITAILIVCCSAAGLILECFSLNLPKWNLLSGFLIVLAVNGFIYLRYRGRIYKLYTFKKDNNTISYKLPLTLPTIVYADIIALVFNVVAAFMYGVFVEAAGANALKIIKDMSVLDIIFNVGKFISCLSAVSQEIPIVNLGLVFTTIIITLLEIANEFLGKGKIMH